MRGDELRLLVLTPDYPPEVGGIQQLLHRLVRELPGVRARVVTLDSPGADEFDRSRTRTRRVRRLAGRQGPSVALLNAAGLQEALGSRPQAVLSGHITVAPAAAAIATLQGAPFVQYLHAKEIGTRPRLARFATRSAAASIAVSRHSARLAESVGAPRDRLQVIPPGIELPAASGESHAARPTVVTVAQLADRYKGFDVLVRALPLIRSRVAELRWVLVGDGPLRVEIEHLVAAHRLDGAVRLVGAVSDAERDAWLDRAHVFAMPSRLPPGEAGGEGFGIAFLEASARGIPVVGGNVGGALDAVLDGTTGLLVDPTDHLAVAGAIGDLLEDPRRAAELGRAGREHAQRFEWPRIAERVGELLRRVASAR